MEPEVVNPASDEVDARAAHFEREENFRWLSSLLAATSPLPLTERVAALTQQSIYALAEFAEISHGSLDPCWMLAEENRRHMGRPTLPLEQYPTLSGVVNGELEPIQMVEKFYGTRGDLQGYCALRMSPRTPSIEVAESHRPDGLATNRPQIILAFSGTSNARLALYDVMVAPLGYKTSFSHPSKYSWRVHDGFQRVYRGIRSPAFMALKRAITAMEANLANQNNQEWDLVITAHSLGGAVSYLVLLDLLQKAFAPDGLEPEVPLLPQKTNVTIATFGAPRVANPALVNHYRELIETWRQRRDSASSLTEWPIIGHMDGVPALPPTFFGYAHFSAHPFYSYGGHLYHIPVEQNEYTNFKVEPQDNEPVLFARGGHNYYGARDMERLQRRMKAIFQDIAPPPPVPPVTSLLNLPPKLRTRSHRSISEAGGRLKNSRVRQLSDPHQKRAVSLPGGGAEEASGSSPGPEQTDDGDDPEELSTFVHPDVPLNAASEHPWVQRYLEREEKEEQIWSKSRNPRTLWGTLKGVVSFGVHK